MKKKYCRANAFTSDNVLLPKNQRTYITNEGYNCVIIDGGSKPHHVTCDINGDVFEARAGNVRNGEIAYLNHKSMCEVGYIGYGKYTPKNSKQAYKQWGNMLNRCYSEIYLTKFPTYRDVTVHEDWHNFQNFAEWFYEESNYQKGWQLDKDLLSEDCKVYSNKTCVFLPPQLNSFIISVPLGANNLPRGIALRKDTNKYNVRFSSKLINNGKTIQGGCFETIQEATKKLKEIQKMCIPEVKEFYKGIVSEEILKLV